MRDTNSEFRLVKFVAIFGILLAAALPLIPVYQKYQDDKLYDDFEVGLDE
jgi:hypothetical protein